VKITGFVPGDGKVIIRLEKAGLNAKKDWPAGARFIAPGTVLSQKPITPVPNKKTLWQAAGSFYFHR
jgi:hypothetical protein